MPKKAAIVKSCPKCDSNVAVASKTCKCGYSFFNAKRGVRSSSRTNAGSNSANSNNTQASAIATDVDERRRTSRIRREKPNFYDSQEFDKKKKKKDRRVSE